MLISCHNHELSYNLCKRLVRVIRKLAKSYELCSLPVIQIDKLLQLNIINTISYNCPRQFRLDS